MNVNRYKISIECRKLNILNFKYTVNCNALTNKVQYIIEQKSKSFAGLGLSDKSVCVFCLLDFDVF